MAKRHVLKEEWINLQLYFSYCGKVTSNPDLFLRRAVKGDICKNCIRCRIAHKRKVRSS